MQKIVSKLGFQGFSVKIKIINKIIYYPKSCQTFGNHSLDNNLEILTDSFGAKDRHKAYSGVISECLSITPQPWIGCSAFARIVSNKCFKSSLHLIIPLKTLTIWVKNQTLSLIWVFWTKHHFMWRYGNEKHFKNSSLTQIVVKW